MRGGIILKILEILDEITTIETGTFLDAFLTDYHTSYRILRGIPPKRRKRREEWNPQKRGQEREFKETQLFYVMLSRLKKQGFVEKKSSRGSSIWTITKKGREKIRAIYERNKNQLPPRTHYQQEASPEWKIVIFDIPEKEKRKREWLRPTLRRLGFRQLQKSVWIGKVAIPEIFLEDLKKLHMLEYIEIFAITKSGSIRQIE